MIVWDKVEDRTYETGLDRGVLYLPDGSAVAWNGLTSIIESFDKESSPVYFDGMKISDLVVLGDFEATMTAVTYPEEFVELEGLAPVKQGLFYADQKPQTFGLCYRTKIGNSLEGDEVGYKIHIIYNLTAIPNDKTYASTGSDPSLVPFEWKITAVPEELPGFRPTAHIVIDSRDIDPWLLEDLEMMLYGTSTVESVLIPMPDLVEFINEWYRVQIVDNGDGTWIANSLREGLIFVNLSGYFEIVGVNAVYLDDDTYMISNTTELASVPQIKIAIVADGIWNAATDHDSLISIDVDGEFEISNATVVWLNDYTYQISDTPNE